MQAMILAAGEGTRMRPLSDHLPKCMFPLGGQPALERTIRWLVAHGVSKAIVNLRRPAAVVGYFGDGSRWKIELRYSLEERLLGIQQGLRRMARIARPAEPVVIVYGDVVPHFLASLPAFSQAVGVSVYAAEEFSQGSVLALDPSGSILSRTVEPIVPGCAMDAGMYYLPQDLFQRLVDYRGLGEDAHLLDLARQLKIPLRAFQVPPPFDLGNMASYLRALDQWKEPCG